VIPTFSRKGDKPIVKEVRVNAQIRAPQVRLIGSDGHQVGIVGMREALARAQQEGLDLVEISAEANPPVCKVMNYGKYHYEQEKKAKLAKKKQHVVKLKEVRLRPKTDEHDYQFKMRQATEFLASHHRVKVTIKFRGREMTHQEFGRKMMDRLIADLKEAGKPEGFSRMEGQFLVATFIPK
jgi:translation initiation factor IF-3